MNAHKLQVKLFTEPGAPALDSFVPVFHSWIKHHALGELLVDVANYSHVPDGPGVGIVGHGSDFFMDQTGGRLGLLVSRKRMAPPPEARLADAFRRTVNAARLLEADANLIGKLRFRTNDWLFRVNDRLAAAPNSDETFAPVRDELHAFSARLFAGTSVSVDRVGDARQLLSVRIRTDNAIGLDTLLDRLGGPMPVGDS